MIKGVFFDVGGTLYSYANMERLTREFLSRFADRFPVDDDPDTLFGHYSSATKHADRIYAVQPFYLFKHYFHTTFESLMDQLGLDKSPDDFDWFKAHQIDMLVDGMDLMPGCHATLETLKERGLYLSVVSNADDDMLRSLIERGDLERRLDHWTSSEAAKSCKPDTRFFQVALEKAELNASDVLFVGDSLEQDIQGAHDAGMATVLISDGDDTAPMHLGHETVEPDYRISELNALADIVDSHR